MFQIFPRFFRLAHFFVCLNIFVYLFLCFQGQKGFLNTFFQGPDAAELLFYGAKQNGLIALGQWYRIFTSLFLHANLIHMVVSAFTLWHVGANFERQFGWKRFFCVYMLCGISGSLCSFSLLPGISVGDAGGLFGLFAFLALIQICRSVLKFRHEASEGNLYRKFLLYIKFVDKNLLVLAVLNVLFCFVSSSLDAAGCLGGTMVGLLCGFAFISTSYLKTPILSESFSSVARYAIPGEKSNFRCFLENSFCYYFGIFLMNTLFVMGFLHVKKEEKIYGRAIYESVKNNTPILGYEDLFEYKALLIKEHAEANPDNLFLGGVQLTQQKKFFSAYKVFMLLKKMSSYQFVSPTMEIKNYENALEQACLQSQQDKAIFMTQFPRKTDSQAQEPLAYSQVGDYCLKPADLFMALGFFDIAGHLYECAYVVDGTRDDVAFKALQAFYKSKNEQGQSEVMTWIRAFSK